MVDSGSLGHATEQGFVAPLGKPLFRPFDEASVHIVAWNGSPDRVDVGGGGIQSFGFLRARKQMLLLLKPVEEDGCLSPLRE